MRTPPFIGDLSRADAQILAEYASRSKSIIEFGCGGSTQIIAQAAPRDADIISVETDPLWIGATKEMLAELATRPVTFVNYADLSRLAPEAPFDLVFNDGKIPLRPEFAAWVNPHLDRGGAKVLVHDAQFDGGLPDIRRAIFAHFALTNSIHLCPNGSHMAVITTGVVRRYKTWHNTPGAAPWMFDARKPRPRDWTKKVANYLNG